MTDKDIYGMNALHIASYYSNLESVKLLLNYYENLNYKTDRGMTALHLAVWKNDMNIMKLLLYNGADIKIQNNEGRTVLHIASINNNEGILNYLLNNYNCNYYCKDNYGKQFFNYLNDDFY